MSESGAGTDVLGMSTNAVLCPDGSSYLLNGSKMWITNGTITGSDTGDVFLVYAKTGKGRGVGDLTSFLGTMIQHQKHLIFLYVIIFCIRNSYRKLLLRYYTIFLPMYLSMYVSI